MGCAGARQQRSNTAGAAMALSQKRSTDFKSCAKVQEWVWGTIVSGQAWSIDNIIIGQGEREDYNHILSYTFTFILVHYRLPWRVLMPVDSHSSPF